MDILINVFPLILSSVRNHAAVAQIAATFVPATVVAAAASVVHFPAFAVSVKALASSAAS